MGCWLLLPATVELKGPQTLCLDNLSMVVVDSQDVSLTEWCCRLHAYVVVVCGCLTSCWLSEEDIVCSSMFRDGLYSA